MRETIAAIATPPGTGGLGIIRISGAHAEAIARTLFQPRTSHSQYQSHHLYHGDLVDPDTGVPLDEVLLTVMRGPHSFTGEDVAEIHCHGGAVVLQRILAATLKAGARPAEPGEYTRRAFLNRRIDLAQAEAVCDMITAKTERALTLALSQLKGDLSRRIDALRTAGVAILARIELGIDFTEEERETVPDTSLAAEITEMIDQIKELLGTYRHGQLYRQGVRVVLLGRTNVGKSSLFNRLLGTRRAIVTAVAGTTRDYIEETLNLHGLPVVLTDTAGIRETDNPVEAAGIGIVWERFAEADLAVLVFDGSAAWTDDDALLLEKVGGKTVLPVLNKADLPHRLDPDPIVRALPGGKTAPLWISAKRGDGMADLEKRLHALCLDPAMEPSPGVWITHIRHKQALEAACDGLLQAREAFRAGCSPELPAEDLRSALEHLGEIDGQAIGEDVLDTIFSRFCIGK